MAGLVLRALRDRSLVEPAFGDDLLVIPFAAVEEQQPEAAGYQWWTFPGPDHAYSAEGIRFQLIYVNPADRIVIVKTSAFPPTWNNRLELETYAAFDAIRAALKSK